MKKTCHCFAAADLSLISTRKYFAINFIRTFLLIAGVILFGLSTKAQFTATWAFTTDGSVVTTGAQAANVNAGLMTPFQATGTGTYGNNGYAIQTTRANWPTSASDNYRLDFAISPAAGLTLRHSTSGQEPREAAAIVQWSWPTNRTVPVPGYPLTAIRHFRILLAEPAPALHTMEHSVLL